MPKRCANCGTITGRAREMAVPVEWVRYLRRERGVSEPVGTLRMPLCTDCYRDVDRLLEGDVDPDERDEFLDGLDADALIDDGA